jgi:hypothetical protein
MVLSEISRAAFGRCDLSDIPLVLSRGLCWDLGRRKYCFWARRGLLSHGSRDGIVNRGDSYFTRRRPSALQSRSLGGLRSHGRCEVAIERDPTLFPGARCIRGLYSRGFCIGVRRFRHTMLRSIRLTFPFPRSMLFMSYVLEGSKSGGWCHIQRDLMPSGPSLKWSRQRLREGRSS